MIKIDKSGIEIKGSNEEITYELSQIIFKIYEIAKEHEDEVNFERKVIKMLMIAGIEGGIEIGTLIDMLLNKGEGYSANLYAISNVLVDCLHEGRNFLK